MLHTLYAALVFYTALPIAPQQPLNFSGIAWFAPLVGLVIGLGLTGINWVLSHLFTSSALPALGVVLAWIALSGGLHLDGVMDSADGLAVTDPQKRLAVMADSLTGAYGVMAAIALILLKFASLIELASLNHALSGLVLTLAPAWGRWAQLYTIGYHPYLKAEGKGKFHQQGIGSGQIWTSALGLVLAASAIAVVDLNLGWQSLGLGSFNLVIGMAIAHWFNFKLGGQTGDTYGAIVEWTEAVSLVAGAILIKIICAVKPGF
ncbi:MAG: adenosylcobinamide-GDP ribazoletransferase [Pseudanabaenaceae cyanobacterium bins.68]|nr:adenosylcobinamide-GDP ribazoletransferase [Pseudanabaenaceae cyanobacterium bins.68]